MAQMCSAKGGVCLAWPRNLGLAGLRGQQGDLKTWKQHETTIPTSLGAVHAGFLNHQQ